MITPIEFDHQGEMLWINIEMFGIYFITYTYQLWSSSTTTPPILTNPLKAGSNEIPHDDFHPVINDYNPTEDISNYVDRTIDVRFWIKKGDDDNGYSMKVTVYQGPTFQSAQELGSDKAEGIVGDLSIKEEFVTIKLV
jgi:hypothetical protein